MANMKTNFEYHIPTNMVETLSLLAEYGNDCKVIAGGTDLIPKLKAGIAEFNHLISLKDISELKKITFDSDKGITIGANVDLRTTEHNQYVQKYYPALYTGMHSMANTQIRNIGTIVGNICNAVPSADTAPALLVYDAQVKVVSKHGERIVPLDEFFTGVCKTVLKSHELVSEIFIPLPKEESYSIYYKYTIRKALELAMVGIAVNVLVDDKKIVQDAKIALGAVSTVPKHAVLAEQFIIGKELTDELILKAAEIAGHEDCSPISDIRATAEYRRKMVYIHVRDALRKVVEA